MKKEKLLKITQVRSKIGAHWKAKRTLEALGLRKIGHTVVKKDTPQIRGMIERVRHLVKVEEVTEKEAKGKKAEKKGSTPAKRKRVTTKKKVKEETDA